jgi:hypothetical protein
VLSERELSAEFLEIISYYAMLDPDPEADTSHESAGGDYGGNLYDHCINSVRGRAARTMASLLYDDSTRIERLKPALESLASDQTVSVRTCALTAFISLLNSQPDLAVQLFCKACVNCEPICGTPPFERFVHYAIHTHYPQIRHMVYFALSSTNNDAVQSASRQIILAELGGVDVEEDADNVRRGRVEMRKTAAEVYAHNLKNADVSPRCSERLEQFFDDDDESVRAEVSECFWHLDGERLLELSAFIGKFIESKCFESDPDRFLRALEESNAELPHIICRAAERILQFLGEEGTHIAYHGASVAHSLATLVVRQYEQTTDAATKTRCLDLLDRMQQVGYYGVVEELTKIDR